MQVPETADFDLEKCLFWGIFSRFRSAPGICWKLLLETEQRFYLLARESQLRFQIQVLRNALLRHAQRRRQRDLRSIVRIQTSDVVLIRRGQ